MTKPNLLLINPNTTSSITDSILQLGLSEVGERVNFTAVTADFGARYIASRASVAVAAHAVLDAYANAVANGPRPDGVIVACFGDPGLDALQEIAGVPVMGFADQGLVAAAAAGGRFAIATIGDSWHDMLVELVRRRQLEDHLGGIIVLDEAARDPAIGGPAIDQAALALDVDRVIIGGTGLIPVLDGMASGVSLPVIDPHRITFQDMLRAMERGASLSTQQAQAVPVVGLSPALADLLEGRISFNTTLTQDAS